MLRFALASLASLALLASAEEEGHEHHAPHGGTLVVFGEEAAHVEFVLDPKTGKLTAWVLDGEAENAVRIKQKEIVIEIEWPAEKEGGERKKSKVTLAAVANVLTGETVGDTSEFAATLEELKGATSWDGVIALITIKGKEYKDTAFNFPKGNEDEEEHEGK